MPEDAADINVTNARLDEISDYILEKTKGTNIKCLWGTANMFNNPRFMNGAGSTNSAEVYCFAAATAIGFLRQYGLDKDFKLNIEANHATLAGHTFQHELRVSAMNGMLGSIDANQGDMLLGWDTDEFPFNVYDTTLAMYEVLKAGGINGGFNFDSKNRRPSNTYEDMFHGYILGMDTFALGLIKAAELIEDGRIDKLLNERYISYSNTEVGKKIRDHSATLEELAACAAQMKKPTYPESGRQELLEQIMNEVLFG